MSNKLYVTRNEAAAQMGVSPQSISNYIEKGLIKATRHGQVYFIDRASFEDFVSSYVGQQVKTSEEGLKDLQNEVETLRNVLQEEKDRLSQQIAQMKMKRTFNMIANASYFADFIDILLEPTEDDMLRSRERYIISKMSRGGSMRELSSELDLTTERIRHLFHRGLRKAMEKYKDAVSRQSRERELFERAERQAQHIKQLNEEVQELKRLIPPNGRVTPDVCRIKELMNTDAYSYLRGKASVRILNGIRFNNKDLTMFDLVTMKVETMLGWRNVWKRSIDELRSVLEADGLSLEMEFDGYAVTLAKLS